MKKQTKFKIIEYSLIFIIFSFLGSLIEYLSHFIGGSGIAYDKSIFLITGLKIFFIPFYGLVGIILFYSEKLMDKIKTKFIYRGIIHGITITLLELIFGYFGFLIFKTKIWNYSNQFLNFEGYISAGMFLIWSLAGYIFSVLYLLLKKLKI